MTIRTTVIMGFLIAIAAVLHVVESWLPVPVPIPGAKLGLANVVTLIALVWLGRRSALVIAAGRVMIASLLGGSLAGPAFVMSLSGAISSLVVMDAGWRYGSRYFSVVGISVLGAVTHSLVQLVVAAVLVASSSVLWYLPWLVLFSLPTGIVTGVAAGAFLRYTSQFSSMQKF